MVPSEKEFLHFLVWAMMALAVVIAWASGRPE